MKEVIITVGNHGQEATINLVLFTPTGVSQKVPVFLLINNRSARNTAPERDTLSGFWPAEEVISAGYGIAAFQVNDAAPDNKVSYREGILKLFPELQNAPNGMKAIGAWAWAASRVMDYFERDREVDARKVIVVGHSRGGKPHYGLLLKINDLRCVLAIIPVIQGLKFHDATSERPSNELIRFFPIGLLIIIPNTTITKMNCPLISTN